MVAGLRPVVRNSERDQGKAEATGVLIPGHDGRHESNSPNGLRG
jgi:hypothetical protein